MWAALPPVAKNSSLSAIPTVVNQAIPCKIRIVKIENDFGLTRRQFLAASLVGPATFFIGWADGLAAREAVQGLEPTPACGDADGITPPQTAGPFYKPRSPERKSLHEPGIQGARIVLEGYVRSTKCKPIQGALVDFWQADASGAYDNAGY